MSDGDVERVSADQPTPFDHNPWLHPMSSTPDPTHYACIHTHPRTVFIPLPPAFVRWLRQDGPLVLPPSVTLSSTTKEDNVSGWEDDEPQQLQVQGQEREEEVS